MPADTDQFAQPTAGTTNPDNAAYSADGKPDRYGRYRVPNLTSGRMATWTRATTFAKTISDTYTLNMWGRRMTILGLVRRPDLIALASQCADPSEDRERLNDIAEKAADHAGSKVAANLGTALHTFTEQEDRGEAPFVPAPWDRDVAAYRAVMLREGLSIVPGCIEGLIVCTRWGVAGTFDRVLETGRECPSCGRTRRIGDLKTGRDLSYGWLEIAVQLSVYAWADAIWDKVVKEYRPMPEVCRCSAVVMHLPVGEARCTLYDVDLLAGAQLADLCATVRDARKRRDLAVPRALAETAPAGQGPGVTIDRPPTYAERIAVARTPEELSLLWREGIATGEWTDDLTAAGMRRLAAIKAG